MQYNSNNPQGYGSFPRPYDGNAGMQYRRISGLLPCGNCCVSVPQDQFYAEERFGKFERMLQPGLACVGCDCGGLCIQFRGISKRVQQNECLVETKTKDNVFLLVRVAIQQAVIKEKAFDAMYRLASVDSQIDAYVADVVRSHVPNMSLDEAFEMKDSIGGAVMRALSEQMEEFGFEIRSALVTEVKPDQVVMGAMNEINKQKRLRDASIMRAEGEKILVVKAAEALRDAGRLQGEGIALQRTAIVDGLRESIQDGSDEDLSSDRISELLLIVQYFETLKEIGMNSKSNSVFVPHSPTDGLSDIAKQIKAGVLTARNV
eukprot:TRINITY_DN65222_c0_g1_i1.p1 TRINITY_DN65222_c0_g1~~TRINITY_DN65222_c0_g1_i1.p1  ORF type:complete len:347 (-),score=64.17 TRINITY_DN65222_c0_g1_i1:54-1007(-)